MGLYEVIELESVDWNNRANLPPEITLGVNWDIETDKLGFIVT